MCVFVLAKYLANISSGRPAGGESNKLLKLKLKQTTTSAERDMERDRGEFQSAEKIVARPAVGLPTGLK